MGDGRIGGRGSTAAAGHTPRRRSAPQSSTVKQGANNAIQALGAHNLSPREFSNARRVSIGGGRSVFFGAHQAAHSALMPYNVNQG
eukprot:365767-Chlamydomonas_euryale.AAC.12